MDVAGMEARSVTTGEMNAAFEHARTIRNKVREVMGASWDPSSDDKLVAYVEHLQARLQAVSAVVDAAKAYTSPWGRTDRGTFYRDPEAPGTAIVLFEALETLESAARKTNARSKDSPTGGQNVL